MIIKDNGYEISDEQSFKRFAGNSSIPVALWRFYSLNCFLTNILLTYLNLNVWSVLRRMGGVCFHTKLQSGKDFSFNLVAILLKWLQNVLAFLKSLFKSFSLEKVTDDWTGLGLDPGKIDLIIFQKVLGLFLFSVKIPISVLPHEKFKFLCFAIF